MKKGVSIIFSLVLLISGVRFTIATHYCGGEVAATKVSLSGKLASCGMEVISNSLSSPGKHLSSHCCEDSLTIVGALNNFLLPDLIQSNNTQDNSNAIYIPVNQSFSHLPNFNHISTDIGPPGEFPASAVSLNDICTFRI